MLSIHFYHFALLHSSILVSVEAESYALLNISEQDPEKGSTISQ